MEPNTFETDLTIAMDALNKIVDTAPSQIDGRLKAIAKTQFELGEMALRKAIVKSKPTQSEIRETALQNAIQLMNKE